MRVRDSYLAPNAAPVKIAVKGGSSRPQSIENHDGGNKSPKELRSPITKGDPLMIKSNELILSGVWEGEGAMHSTTSKIDPMTRREFVKRSGTAGLVIGAGSAAPLEPAQSML